MAINPALAFGLRLKTKRQKTLEKKINKSVVSKINSGLLKAQKELTYGLREIIREKIYQSPEYVSLLTATLRGEFGLSKPKYMVNTVVDVFLQSFRTQLKLASVEDRTFYANLSIEIKVNFEKLVEIPEAFQEATNQDTVAFGGEVSLLPWLRWLLLEGTSSLVFDHSVVRDQGKGRSGLKFLMSYTPGSNFSISHKNFTGTESSNFLTRAISENRVEIEQYIRKKSSELLRRSFKV